MPESTELTKKRLTEDTMSQQLRGMEYAVRGKVVIAADKINEELASGKSEYPFDHIVYTNIGNPHSVGQTPLTWPRQVVALVELPDNVGVNHPDALKLFPADAIQRAKEIKAGLNGMGTGAYTHSKGAKCFREDIAKFIEARDGGVPCDPEDIFMTNGASAGIGMILTALIANSKWYVSVTDFPTAKDVGTSEPLLSLAHRIVVSWSRFRSTLFTVQRLLCSVDTMSDTTLTKSVDGI